MEQDRTRSAREGHGVLNRSTPHPNTLELVDGPSHMKGSGKETATERPSRGHRLVKRTLADRIDW